MSNTKDTTYNGWANYETWLLNIWWDDAFRDDAKECSSVQELADRIKSTVEESLDEQTSSSGFAADLINAALSEVDWYEIAEHYDEDLHKVCSVCDSDDDVEEITEKHDARLAQAIGNLLCSDCRELPEKKTTNEEEAI